MVRFKNRYITVEVNYASKQKPKLCASELIREVQKTVQVIHGDFGCASIRSGLSAKYCNELTRIAVIRTRSGAHKLLTSSLPFLNKIGKDNVNIRIIYVGGTLRHCFKRILVHQKAELTKLTAKPLGDKTLAEIEKELMTIGGFFEDYKQVKIS